MDFSKMKVSGICNIDVIRIDEPRNPFQVAELKKECKNRGLSTVGNKNELQERLQLASLETDAALDPNISELLDEDVLNVSS